MDHLKSLNFNLIYKLLIGHLHKGGFSLIPEQNKHVSELFTQPKHLLSHYLQISPSEY